MNDMKQEFIDVSGGRVFYWLSDIIDPTRDTIFFMHGMTADHTMFEKQIDAFKEGCNLVLWDAPAHGESRPYEGFSFSDAVNCITRILDENRIDKVILVGQSLGGYFAQAFIKNHPERVKGFVSIGSTPFGIKYYSNFDKWILKQIEWMAKLYPLKAMRKAIAKQVSVTQAAYDNMLKMLEPYGKNELCHLMGLGYSAFLNENCDIRIPCPVLLTVGKHDKTGKVRSYNKQWAQDTGFPLIQIPDAAHNANVDNPDFVNNCILDFIKGL